MNSKRSIFNAKSIREVIELDCGPLTIFARQAAAGRTHLFNPYSS